MKTKSILFGLLALALAGLFIATNNEVAADSPKHEPAVVVIGAWTLDAWNFPQASIPAFGIYAATISVSPGVEQPFPVWGSGLELKSVAEVMAYYRVRGFRMTTSVPSVDGLSGGAFFVLGRD